MKRLVSFLLYFVLTATMAWAQSSMTDNQVMDFVVEQNAKGVSRQQIVTQLMQRGVTIDQIRRIQKKYQRQMKNGALGAEDITAGSKEVKNRMREANGERRADEIEREKRNASNYRIKDNRKKKLIARKIEEVAFQAVMIREVKENLITEGLQKEVVNGSQHYPKENPAVGIYDKNCRAYQSNIDKLIEYLPPKEVKAKSALAALRDDL